MTGLPTFDSLAVSRTDIPGLLVIDLPLHWDSRGWFKENWQRQKMTELGLPDFGPVQNNMSFNEEAGVTRGMHAEPWDKLVSLATGRIYGAWVDLRPGASFGATFALEMGPERAVFVPRGVANGYQALEAHTTYSYLVNDHWSPQARDSYTYVNLADEALGIAWPIPLSEAIVSQADEEHPPLSDVTPMKELKTVITGAGGQLGRALQTEFPEAVALGRELLDISDREAVESFDWSGVGVIINAAAWTAVDAAEAGEGRQGAWRDNVQAVGHLVSIARRHRITLVHVSSDYVFDGQQQEHAETETLSPLGAYGASKAAGDALVSTLDSHYIVRTSWVIGEGRNFVLTMKALAESGKSPAVVDDQFGRLTFTSTLASAIRHLLCVCPSVGTYNVTNDGPVVSWFDVARQVFARVGANPEAVRPQTTEEFGAGRLVAPRPRWSSLSLDKIKKTGFHPPRADEALDDYLSRQRP